MDTLKGRLLELVTRLDKLGPAPTMVALANTLKHAELTHFDVADFVKETARTYHRAHVVVRDAYELLVMTWAPGQASVPHDHSGSICAMQVVKGEAAEGCYRVATDGYVDLEYETLVKGDEVVAGQDAGVHSVRNPTSETMVSVHVYAPPLKDFRQFKRRPADRVEIAASPSRTTPTIVVVGGGFCGSMTAAQILRRAASARTPMQVVLVERRGAVGEGLAYGTRESHHLLNVPAGRMSAWPDRPDDFVAWAVKRDASVRPGDFLPRMWYGEYVRETLLATAREAGEHAQLEVAFDEVRNISRHPDGGWMVHFGRQPSLRADAVVLAVGHRPPSDPIASRWSGPRTRFIADPWRPFATHVIGDDEPVVVLGSGLTAVDAILSIAQPSRKAPITLVSRNGLVPLSHAPSPIAPADLREWALAQTQSPALLKTRVLLGELRRLVDTHGDWRKVLDGLRPHTAHLWQSLPVSERRRFLARLRPFWEVHRHRMAVAVSETFRSLMDRGDVRLVAGRIEAARADQDGVALRIRERATGQIRETSAGWVLNCTGPVASNSAESNPAIGSLLVGGWLQPDALSLGIITTEVGNAVATNGQPVPDLYVVGTLRKPAHWESTAVPELRVQAAGVAESLLNQQLGMNSKK